MNAPISAPMRRGACPGLSAPMATGDGLLARLTPADSIALSAFAGLCAAARRYGNGIIEITSRGSIQFRGLSEASAGAFAAEVARLGIPASDGIPVIADPLSGLECGGVLDVRPLAAELRQALASAPFAPGLSAKLSIVIDGGGPLHLDDLPADIRLRAVHDGRLLVALAGTAATAIALGAVMPGEATECVVRLIEVLATIAPHMRMREAIATAGIEAWAPAIDDRFSGVVPPASRPEADPIGIHALRSGDVAIGIAPPFGHSDAEAMRSLIDLAARAGAEALCTAPKRALLVAGVPAAVAHDFVAAAQAMDFVVDAGDPRRRVIACAGAPICSSGQIPARALAPILAEALNANDMPSLIHVSGCIKGCAYPAAAPMTIVGRNGACEIYQGENRVDFVTVGVLPERLARLISSGAPS